jgi:hypothetical protein
MIEPNIRDLSVGRQRALRSSFYYEPKGEPGKNLNLMQLVHGPIVAACSDERDVPAHTQGADVAHIKHAGSRVSALMR